MNLECKLLKKIRFGDHIMFAGTVVAGKTTNEKPLVYHIGKYWELTKMVKRVSKKKRQFMKGIVENYKK